MADDNYHALELLYSLAQKQPYRQPATHSPPGAEFKPMFEQIARPKFVLNTLLQDPRRWQPAPAPQKI
jgi:hypothetical protein